MSENCSIFIINEASIDNLKIRIIGIVFSRVITNTYRERSLVDRECAIVVFKHIVLGFGTTWYDCVLPSITC